MAKLDGLVWKKGDDGWKDIPAGIGHAGTSFNIETDDAVVRVEDQVKAGFGGKKIDFTKLNDLEKAVPPDNDLDKPPKVQWAGVHPTNLAAGIILWSRPVIILDPERITGGSNPSMNGRVMTVQLDGTVKIDGSDTKNISIQAGAVGSYGEGTDNDSPNVTSNLSELSPATQNDSSLGDDQTSQTVGEKIPVFYPCQSENITVGCVYTYKVEDALQVGACAGKPHKIWGACFCIWGSTIPLGVFPFGQTVDLDPAALGPDNSQGLYPGVISSTSYVDRGAQCVVRVTGVSGPSVSLKGVNDSPLPFQPGAFVGFEAYNCETVCGVADATKIREVDEALAYVDEDIIKPQELTLPLHTFLETTYYMTTMNAITTATLTSFISTQYLTTLVTKIWQDTQVYGTAVEWNEDLKFPEGTIDEILGVTVDGEIKVFEADDLESGSFLKFAGAGGTPLAEAGETTLNFLYKPGVDDIKSVTSLDEVVASDYTTGTSAVTGVGDTDVTGVSVGTPIDVDAFPSGGKAVTSIDATTLTRQTITINEVSGGGLVSGVGTLSLTSQAVTFCVEGGGETTLNLLVLASAGSVSFVTSVTTVSGSPVTFYPLTAGADVSVVTAVNTALPETVQIPVLNTAPPVNVVTSVTLTPFGPVTAHFVGTAAIPSTDLFPVTATYRITEVDGEIPTGGMIVNLLGTAPATVYKVTGEATPPHIDLTKYKELIDFTVFSDVGDPLKMMHPTDDPLYLAEFDPEAVIPILDVVGPPEKEVRLLISNTDGNLKLVGGIDPLRITGTVRNKPGVCTPGSTGITTNDQGPYCNEDEIILLGPIPVLKDKGNAEECPCFTVPDTDGGPSVPVDNSVLASANPCTIRVRRIQLKECHL